MTEEFCFGPAIKQRTIQQTAARQIIQQKKRELLSSRFYNSPLG